MRLSANHSFIRGSDGCPLSRKRRSLCKAFVDRLISAGGDTFGGDDFNIFDSDKAQDLLHVSSCEISRGTDWKTVIGSGGLDIVTAKQEIDANVGRSGVMWLCNARAGGEGQPPILVVEDVTRAGWNALMNRESCATGSAGSGGDAGAKSPPLFR